MATTATIQSITKVGDNLVGVNVLFSDNSTREYQFEVDTDKSVIRQAVKAEVVRLNSIDGKVANLQSLVGVVID